MALAGDQLAPPLYDCEKRMPREPSNALPPALGVTSFVEAQAMKTSLPVLVAVHTRCRVPISQPESTAGDANEPASPRVNWMFVGEPHAAENWWPPAPGANASV